jgi:FtsZ-binding cell division protein ZapB
MSNFIPIKIAELALEEKDKEIARLKADAERYRLASIRVDVGELHAQFNRALFDETIAENARLKAEVDRLKEGNECLDQMHEKEMARSAFLCEQVERLTLENSQYEEHHKYGQNVITSLREDVERLTKAVMHSPAAQLKLKELEGKTTFDEINPKEVLP